MHDSFIQRHEIYPQIYFELVKHIAIIIWPLGGNKTNNTSHFSTNCAAKWPSKVVKYPLNIELNQTYQLGFYI